MKRALLLLLLLLPISLSAFERNAPWLPPLFEIQAEAGYFYTHTERVESPAGSFTYLNDYHNPWIALGVTFLPDLFISGSLGFVQTNTISFSYESFVLTARKQWFDDLYGDWITLTTGLSVALPPTRLLHDFNYPFHGYCNGEFDLTLGKEFRNLCTMDWSWRLWGLFGWGVAERGSPWLRGLCTVEHSLPPCSQIRLFAELLYGLGARNILPNQSFPGYASIAHQTIDLGIVWDYQLVTYATLSFMGFVNVYAHNFTEHSFGCSAFLTIPFSL